MIRETKVKIGWVFATVFAIHLLAVLYLVVPRGGPGSDPAENGEAREPADRETGRPQQPEDPEVEVEVEEAPDYILYEVRRGDSLSVIARRHGTTVGEIRRLNDLSGDVIHPGQELRLPGEE